ncbi:nucleotidyltransferase family protein [Stakelama saccharophila]|uniref:Nucleotidyltransferase family protein n=1 Tax=Stakelama saccharophila TaxID=3075605 RepID=A0ABZ0BBL4_9SPHN|nr:nucleotidyltransferase family protein [Stakelama sp. W311]WNO54445.1 nucleotidyltransferase family protein [Stakelama sp. W311]
MIAAEDTALVLLAAGRSERFGDTDKLTIDYLGRPLGLHVVTALEAIPFAARIGVVSDTALDLATCGYQVVLNERPETGMARSLRLGVERAMETDATAVLIALADMPRVTATHVWRLLDYARGPDTVIASSDGTIPRPPALFGRDHFGALLSQTGDQGARDLIRAGHHVVTSPRELIDIDTPEDFARLKDA